MAAAPALPWGILEPEAPPASSPPAPTIPKPRLSLSDVGVAVGDVIEVEWQVTPADGSEPFSRWWGATVVGTAQAATAAPELAEAGATAAEPEVAAADATAEAGQPSGPHFDILYQPYEDFLQERATVAFTSKRRLLDNAHGFKMTWRREGCETAPSCGAESSDDEEDDDEGDESGAEGEEVLGGRPGDLRALYAASADGTVTLTQVNDELARQGVKSGDEHVAALLATMPPTKQRQMADAFASFRDQLSSFMNDKMESKRGTADEDVVTADDVRDFTRSLEDAKRRRL